MLRRTLAAIAVLVLAAIVVVALTDGRGADAGEAALAIHGTRTTGFDTSLQLEVECADHIRVEIRDDPEGSGLDQVTVWGQPRVGRCTPTDAVVDTHELTRRAADRGRPPPTKFVDGATSQVVEFG